MTTHSDLPNLPEIIRSGLSLIEAIQFSRWMMEHRDQSLTPDDFRDVLRDVVVAQAEQCRAIMERHYLSPPLQ